jgi:hypothetical protein
MTLTIVYFFDVKRADIFKAIRHMQSDRGPLKRYPDVEFFKLLGTGTGETFTPRDANMYRWGILVTINESKVDEFDKGSIIAGWRKFAQNEMRLTLAPIAVHGTWSGKQPFHSDPNFQWDGPVVAITRASIKWRKNLLFWRATPPVILSLRKSPGLELAIGIGEAPIGLQGTLSIWSDAASIRNFAYKDQAHSAVISETAKQGWYKDELFARFALIQKRGSISEGL